MSYFESQTFDSSWSTINSSNSEANSSTWSVLDSPQHSPAKVGKKRELHEVPLDQVYSELPVYLWDHHIWPKLDLDTLLEAHRALADDGSENCGRSQNSIIHQSRIQNYHIPNSIPNSSLLEITNSLQKHSKKLKLSSKTENSKSRLRHTPPKRRKLIFKPTRSITKDQACLNQIQKSIINKIFNLLNLEAKKYPILQKVLKSFLLEAPKKMSLIYLANLKVIVPDCWKDPVTDMRSYVEELSKDYRDLFTIACFTLKILYSFMTVEVRVRIADPVLGLMVEMPDSIQRVVNAVKIRIFTNFRSIEPFFLNFWLFHNLLHAKPTTKTTTDGTKNTGWRTPLSTTNNSGNTSKTRQKSKPKGWSQTACARKWIWPVRSTIAQPRKLKCTDFKTYKRFTISRILTRLIGDS